MKGFSPWPGRVSVYMIMVFKTSGLRYLFRSITDLFSAAGVGSEAEESQRSRPLYILFRNMQLVSDFIILWTICVIKTLHFTKHHSNVYPQRLDRREQYQKLSGIQGATDQVQQNGSIQGSCQQNRTIHLRSSGNASKCCVMFMHQCLNGVCLFSQKYRVNADPTHAEDNDTAKDVFDTLFEDGSNHEENDRGVNVAAAIASATAEPAPKPVKKKTVRASIPMFKITQTTKVIFIIYTHFNRCRRSNFSRSTSCSISM